MIKVAHSATTTSAPNSHLVL